MAYEQLKIETIEQLANADIPGSATIVLTGADHQKPDGTHVNVRCVIPIGAFKIKWQDSLTAKKEPGASS